jgi:hypothetical protein
MKNRNRTFAYLLVVFLSLSLSFSYECSAHELILSPEAHQDLVIGYTLLADTFHDEAQVSKLKFLKKIMFRRPVDEVSATMDKIASSAVQRISELKVLRKLEPAVANRPATVSAIGDAITAAAKDAGTGEMLAWRGDAKTSFNLRFMVLQAQATRMVSAMATAIAKHDVNVERKEWLEEVAKEYESYRDEIIEDLRKYIRGQGSAQTDPSWHFRDRIKNTTSIWNQQQ